MLSHTDALFVRRRGHWLQLVSWAILSTSKISLFLRVYLSDNTVSSRYTSSVCFRQRRTVCLQSQKLYKLLFFEELYPLNRRTLIGDEGVIWCIKLNARVFCTLLHNRRIRQPKSSPPCWYAEVLSLYL